MEYPGGKRQHFRHPLFVFHRSQKAAEAARDISIVYGGVIGESTARKWFTNFKKGYFDAYSTPSRGSPSEFEKEHLKAFLKEDVTKQVVNWPKK
ncbi:HTH_48 domain-containing protein [Trichonephila clavata]|uniref:HTH_48 domain-containing protein n=1 Tax=Trichonephila clavata TaxID=2740835 RepID=A0A8X6IZ98_TRICU|nr:HTH_48 domain-containing protein [Trichonephila clavata]